MKRVALISLNGGVGRTTLAAALGRVAAEQRRCVVVDVDPQNTLGLHLGMPLGEPHGLVDPTFSSRDLVELLRAQQPEVPFIPFGRCSTAELREAARIAWSDERWLEARLEALLPSGTDVLVMDTPAGRNPWSNQAVRLADAVLVVVTPDALSYANLADVETLLDEAGEHGDGRHRAVGFLVNRLDPRRALSRDLRSSFAQTLGERLLDVALYEDEAVREAIAERQTVVQYAPHAQLVSGLRDVVAWLDGALR